MQITRLVIESLRAIDHLDIDLRSAAGAPRKRAILLGVNGAGKTTVLEAIVHAFASLAEQPSLDASRLGASDVRNVDDPSIGPTSSLRRGVIMIDVALSDTERRAVRRQFPDASRRGTLRFDVGRNLEFDDLLDEHESIEAAPVMDISLDDALETETERAFEIVARHAVTNRETHPICVFLPADRGVLVHRDDLTLKEIMAFDSCSGSLSRARDRFSPVATRMALAAMGGQSDADRSVARMWKVLEKHFPQMPRPISPDGMMLRFRSGSGAVVPLNSLSDGERAVLLIFGELALRAPQAGVVMIDEIEQHLHPRWQREVIAGLATLLPSVQFIITTQSPYLAAWAPDDLIKLPGWDEHGE